MWDIFLSLWYALVIGFAVVGFAAFLSYLRWLWFKRTGR